MKSKKSNRNGDADKIRAYILSRPIGSTYAIGAIKKTLNLSGTSNTVYTVLAVLEKKGMIKSLGNISPKQIEIVTNSATQKAINANKKLNGKKSHSTERHNNIDLLLFNDHATPPPLTAVQQGFRDDISRAASIDVAETMSRVVSVNEQNRMLRAALESIVLILDQAGIIENSQ